MDEDNDTSFRGAAEGSDICSKWVTGTSQYDQFRVQSAGYCVIGDVVAGLLQFFVFGALDRVIKSSQSIADGILSSLTS